LTLNYFVIENADKKMVHPWKNFRSFRKVFYCFRDFQSKTKLQFSCHSDSISTKAKSKTFKLVFTDLIIESLVLKERVMEDSHKVDLGSYGKRKLELNSKKGRT